MNDLDPIISEVYDPDHLPKIEYDAIKKMAEIRNAGVDGVDDDPIVRGLINGYNLKAIGEPVEESDYWEAPKRQQDSDIRNQKEIIKMIEDVSRKPREILRHHNDTEQMQDPSILFILLAKEKQERWFPGRLEKEIKKQGIDLGKPFLASSPKQALDLHYLGLSYAYQKPDGSIQKNF